MNFIDVTIEPTDLSAAIVARNAGLGVCQSCLMAQALSRSLKTPVSVGYEHAYVYKPVALNLRVPESAIELINIYDQRDYEQLKSLLPRTVRFEVRD